MLQFFINWYNHFKKGTCPRCGLYSSIITQGDYHDRVMARLCGDICDDPFHDRLVSHLEDLYRDETLDFYYTEGDDDGDSNSGRRNPPVYGR